MAKQPVEPYTCAKLEGERVADNPRGFYLRRRFTRTLLGDSAE